jgi:peptidoglycan/LPS O-acetylase OafA/YrhL
MSTPDAGRCDQALCVVDGVISFIPYPSGEVSQRCRDEGDGIEVLRGQMGFAKRSLLGDRMNERIKLDGLLAARCYAAMSIVLFHLALLANLDMPPYLSFVTRYFGIGVPLFYVVSAFSLMIGYSTKLGSRNEIITYFIRRFTRIAPLFYVTIVIYYILLGRAFGKPVSLAEVVSSVLFIFNFVPQHVTGFVMASWSIGVEMAFYLIFPILALTVTDWKRAVALFAVCLFLHFMWQAAFVGAPANLTNFGRYFLVAYMPHFGGGFIAFHIWQAVRRSPHATTIGAAALCFGLVGLVATMAFGRWIVINIGTQSLLVLWPLLLGASSVGIALFPTSLLVGRVSKIIGEASFGMYLWHPLIIVGHVKVGTYKAIYSLIPNLGLAYAACAVVTIVTLCAVAIPSYHLIEKPGNRLAVRFRRTETT